MFFFAKGLLPNSFCNMFQLVSQVWDSFIFEICLVIIQPHCELAYELFQ